MGLAHCYETQQSTRIGSLEIGCSCHSFTERGKNTISVGHERVEVTALYIERGSLDGKPMTAVEMGKCRPLLPILLAGEMGVVAICLLVIFEHLCKTSYGACIMKIDK